MKYILFLLFLSLSFFGYSQKEANIWYFGNNAGLDFGSGNPIPLTDGQLSTVEGCSSFSDSSGNLLFYSDGITVYNKNHQIMQNGNNLGGNPSSSQSGLIVPSPANNNLFYLFTVGTNAVGNSGPQNAGFKYYTIDMTANSGLGKVNNGFVDLSGSLSSAWSEKVTAVQGDGCNSIWVISVVNNSFYSFLIDANGVSTIPVISTVSLNPGGDVRGYLKVSPDATKIVAASMNAGTFLFDFDNITGIVSNGNQLNINGENGYGVEFSLNSKVLYISTGDFQSNTKENLYQFNLNLGTFNTINSSRYLVKSYVNTRGAIQLAPNGKIYWTSDNSLNISVINNPENLGLACNYSHKTVNLGGKTATQGLPPFIQSLFLPNVDIINDGSGILIDHLDLCNGDTYKLEPDKSSYPSTTTYEWYKDESLFSPSITTSSLVIDDSPVYGTGNYKVLITFNDGSTCPFFGEAQIDFHANPTINSPITIKQCDDDTDGIANIDLTLTNESLSNNYSTETFSFFHSQTDAENGDDSLKIINPDNYTTNSTGLNPLWARVENDYCYTVGQINIIVSAANVNFNKTIYKCDDYIDSVQDDYDGISEFDLTQFENELLQEFSPAQQPNLSFAYYTSLNNAQLQSNEISNPSTFRNTNINTTTIPQRIYIRINNNSNIDCAGMGTDLYIDLVVESLPIAHKPFPLHACETVSGSNEAEFDTTPINNLVLQNQANITLSYYKDDENGNLIQIPTPVFNSTYLSKNNIITIRATNNSTNDSDGACYDETQLELIVDDLPTANSVFIQPLCDDAPNQNDGMAVFNTIGIQSEIIGGQLANNMEIHYYNQDGTEILPTLPDNFNTTTQTVSVEVLNIDNKTCTAFTDLYFEVVNNTPIFNVSDQLLCTNLLPKPLEVQVENPLELYSYIWYDSNGDTIPTKNNDDSIALISKAGQYSVTATSITQCTTTILFNVNESSIPSIETITINDNSANNQVAILVSGLGDYEYALDNIINFEDSNELHGHIFNHVPIGLHTIFINDKNGCTPIIKKEVIVVQYPKFISANFDGTHDNFYIYGGNEFKAIEIIIYNRFGKIIKILKNNETWDGTFNEKLAIETDYWFISKLIDSDGKVHNFKGNFSLIR